MFCSPEDAGIETTLGKTGASLSIPQKSSEGSSFHGAFDHYQPFT
jgi:hypothetical protein